MLRAKPEAKLSSAVSPGRVAKATIMPSSLRSGTSPFATSFDPFRERDVAAGINNDKAGLGRHALQRPRDLAEVDSENGKLLGKRYLGSNRDEIVSPRTAHAEVVCRRIGS